jgi:phosphatidylethanolamine-binding protein (PEBP) family uncharacterized protein
MKTPLLAAMLVLMPYSAGLARAHDLGGDSAHPHYDWSVKPPETVQAPDWFFAQLDTGSAKNQPRVNGGAGSATRPAQAIPFEAFAPMVKVHWDARYLFIESNGLPAHGLMTGITNWQQQVPMPQNYTADNAWRIPLAPVPAKTPVSIKGRFLRGAIAIAVNGIPIFNPQNNRGEVSAEIGELDQWGGHCGRADDYHYHAAPLHLQTVAGKGQPIAYALDGYPIYGLTEPDGSQPVGLDEFHGHTTPGMGYHYIASTKYPYVNGGFHGEVVEAEGQVDPQPRAQPVRPALPPLRGAKIIGFTAAPDNRSFSLKYAVSGKPASVNYALSSDGGWRFQFVDANGTQHDETYRARGGGDRSGPQPGGNQPPPERGDARPSVPASGSQAAPTVSAKPSGSFVLRSPAVADHGALPVEFTGDGPGSTLPLEWSGAPTGTKSYALLMHHLDPEGVTKSYWILYNIPANVTSLPKNAKGVGSLGASFKGFVGYEPPHSKGPGAKTYVLTMYALSAAPEVTGPPERVTYDVMLAAMKGKVLASADLSVVYSRVLTPDQMEQLRQMRPPQG